MDTEGSPDSKEKNKLALLSKEELFQKCTKLIQISRQAQLAKQESMTVMKQLQEKISAQELINETLKQDLKDSNQVKDNVVKKLGLVSVETKQLIEQGEKLTTDIETLKQEKLKIFEELSLCQKQNHILSQNIGDLEIRLLQMNEVKGEMEYKINELNKKNQNEAEVSDTIRKLNEENMELKEKNKFNESENQIIQKTLDTLEKTLDNKEKVIKDHEEYIGKLKQAEKEAKERIDVMTKDYEEKLKSLQGILEDKENTIEIHVQTIAQLKENICDVDNKIKSVDNVVKNKNNELEKLQISVIEKDRLIEDLQASVRNNEFSKSNMNSKDKKLEEMELEIEEKRSKLENLDIELKEIIRKCNSLEKQNEINVEKINKFADDLTVRNDAIEKLENDLIEKDKMFKITLQNKETECNELLNSVQIELDDRIKKLHELDGLLNDTQISLEENLDRVKNLENYLKIKDGELEQAQNRIELLVFELDEKSILLKQLETDASLKDEKLGVLEIELKNKEELLKKLKSEGNESQNDEKRDAIDGELKKKADQVQEMESNLNQMNTQLDALRTEIKDKDDCLQQIKRKSSDSDEKLYNLEKELNQRDQKIDTLENELKNKDELLENLKTSINERSMQDTVSDLEHDLKETRSLVDSLVATLKEKEELIKMLENTKDTLTNKLTESNDNLNIIQTEIAIKTERITVCEKEIAEENVKYEHLQKELSDKNERISQLELIIQSNEDSQREKSNYELEKSENFKLNLENLENDNIKCKLEIEYLVEELAQSNQKCKIKQGELESLKGLYDTLSNNYEKLNTESMRQVQCIVSSRQVLSQLKAQKQELVSYLSESQSSIQKDIRCAVRYSEKIKTIKNEQDALLREMSQMNESLKGRGEKIYSLNEEIGSLKEATLILEREKCAVQANLDALREEMVELKEELREEKDVQRRMSDEIGRLKEDARAKEAEFQRKQDLSISMATPCVSTLPDNVTMPTQSVSSATEAENKMETLSTSTLSKADESNRMKDIEDTYEDRYMKLKMLTIKYKKSSALTNEKLASATSENTALIQKLQVLTNQIKTASILQSEYDTLCEKYEAGLKVAKQKDKLVAGLETQRDSLQQSVQELRAQLSEVTAQKNDLLTKHAQLREKFDEKQVSDIIMKDKEHEIAKLSDTNAHLSEQIIELRAKIAQCHSKNLEISHYEKQIVAVEEMKAEMQAKLSSLEDVNDQLKSLTDTHGALSTAHSQLQEDHRSALSKLSVLNQNYQAAQCRVEELLLENTALCSDKQRLSELQLDMEALETRLKEVEAEALEVKLEKAALVKEFEAYKRKAQSVLEKQKKGQMDASSASIEETNGKLTSLEKLIENLKAELSQSQRDLSHLKQTLSLAVAEKENLATQLEQATSELSDKLAAVTALKEDKITADMLIIMYKQQVDEAANQIKTLKQTLAELKEDQATKLFSRGDTDRVPSSKVDRDVLYSGRRDVLSPGEDRERWSDGDDAERRRVEDVMNSNTFVDNLTNMASLYREEGEGSEYTDTPGMSAHSHVPIPLDELLSSTEDQFQHEEDILNRLSSCQSQVLHLTALLNESENNAARHEQQTNFLKEEIRRLERAVERQPHVQNTEYLKNVIIKFLTLQGGDERQRLVPVLNTMLKLSPEEVKQLSGAAKGHSAEAGSSWSSLLGGWPTSSTT